MFIGIKKGVYRHNVIGCHESLEDSKNNAKKFLESEKDDYHSVVIIEIRLNDTREKLIGEMHRSDNITQYVWDWTGFKYDWVGIRWFPKE